MVSNVAKIQEALSSFEDLEIISGLAPSFSFRMLTLFVTDFNYVINQVLENNRHVNNLYLFSLQFI